VDIKPNEEASGNAKVQVRTLRSIVDKVIPWIFVSFIISILIVLILPEVKKAQEKADRTQSANNLKQIWKGIKDYHDAHGHLPPAAAYGKDGEPLYSWRVLLLPFLGEQDLYSQFRLDEPWDGPNNKPLLAKMPLVYAHPTQGKPKEPYDTYYQVFVGGGAVFQVGANSKPLTLTEIETPPDGRGTSNTLLVIEAANPVPWTKPQDLPYTPSKPLPKLGGLYPRQGTGYLFLMADGTVHGAYRGMPEHSTRVVIPWNRHTIDPQ
jgi:hypothetical protein